MTNETEAPDRIWAAECRATNSTMWWPDDAGGTGTEYIRADLSDAQAARIAELEAERDETMREALSLARSLHKTHYSDVTQWEPLDYPAGIISQIDNMVAGIVARAEAAEAKLTDCDPYLKDHETPAQRLESNHKEALSLMKLLEQEKRHSEVWVKAARVAEAKLAKAVRLMELSVELATWNTTLLDDVILFITKLKESEA